MNKYDLVVIGGGPGGYVAAIRAGQLGLKTACVEKNALGGTCLNVGCIPSKALLQSSEAYSWLKNDSAELGITCSKASFNLNKMMQRKEKIVQGLVQGIPTLLKKAGVDSIQGSARFIDKQQLEVTSKGEVVKITADNFILATGSEPITLPFLPFNGKTIISSTEALSLSDVPETMLVVGGGVIGVELASVYNRLGSKIIIVEMLDHICPAMDEAMSKSLLQSLKKQGMEFHLGTKVTGCEKTTLFVEKAGQQQSLKGDIILVAVGRKPYSQGLGLPEIGLQLNKGFVVVDAQFRSSVANIFAIGDLIEGPMLAHRASEEGVAVAEILAGLKPHVNYAALPNVIYTHPEVASVGFTEAEARSAGYKIIVGSSYFKGNSRARCLGFTEGLVKVIGLENHSLIGMHICGPQASEMINIGVMAIEKRATLTDLAKAPIAHPTLSEALKEACGNALGCAIHG